MSQNVNVTHDNKHIQRSIFSIQWVAFSTIVIKEVRRFMRIWQQTLLPPAITMTLYFIIFGNLIGSRIGEMGGVDYMSFIVPGLIMMSVITNAYGNDSSSLLLLVTSLPCFCILYNSSFSLPLPHPDGKSAYFIAADDGLVS